MTIKCLSFYLLFAPFSFAFQSILVSNPSNSLLASKNTRIFSLKEGKSDNKDDSSYDLEQSMSSFAPEYGKIKSFDGQEIDLQQAFAKDEENPAANFFQFDPFEFPDLPNCEAYHGGSQREFMWLQNRELIAIYVPLDDPLQESDIEKSDVEIKFSRNRLEFLLGDTETKVSGVLFGEINPENCYWTFEADQHPRFVNIQLEKNSEFDNWEKLFKEGKTLIEEN
mmetsp:Transcript_22394/g.29294  ORF Transcript_22394/g.29294 Transcript_22394/m.29294 type:complete len:224 (+) Transcript_22394:331-1002(+)